MKLICPECRRENEPERIYCHECGARLDRSALARVKPPLEDPKETHRRLRSMFNPQGVRLRQLALQGGRLILGALALAALVQIVRPPDLPPPPDGLLGSTRQIDLDLEEAVAQPNAQPLRYAEHELNAYLVYKVRNKLRARGEYPRFESAVVELKEGRTRLSVERSLFGQSFYSSVAFVPAIRDGKVTGQIVSGHLGRLPVHPALMRQAEFLFGDLRKALERERKLAGEMTRLEVHPEALILVP